MHRVCIGRGGRCGHHCIRAHVFVHLVIWSQVSAKLRNTNIHGTAIPQSKICMNLLNKKPGYFVLFFVVVLLPEFEV